MDPLYLISDHFFSLENHRFTSNYNSANCYHMQNYCFTPIKNIPIFR